MFEILALECVPATLWIDRLYLKKACIGRR